MARLLAWLTIAFGALAYAPRHADACTVAFVDYFTRFDNATTVAEIEVVDHTTDGDVIVRRLKTLKGATTGTLTATQGGMCPPHYQMGTKVIAFFDEAGKATWTEPRRAAKTLARWKAAKTDRARRKLIATLARSKDASIEMHAVERQRLDAAAPKTAWNAPAPGWTVPGTAKAATARLATLWPVIRAASTDASLGKFDDSFAKQTCNPSASKLTAKAAASRVRDTMGKTDPSSLGTLAALDALGDAPVWLATCSLGFFSVFAYLQASDGALVMLWLPPEG
jgi:hypothetical protein